MSTGVTAAILRLSGTVAKVKEAFTRCRIGAHMAERQLLSGIVGAGSSRVWQGEEFDFCIRLLM